MVYGSVNVCIILNFQNYFSSVKTGALAVCINSVLEIHAL